MRKATFIASMVTIAAAMVLVVTVFVWLLYPYKTTEFYNSPFPLDKPTYTAGDTIQIVMEYERFTKVPAIVSYRFTDGVTFPLVPFVVQKTPGKYKGYVIPPIIVPAVLPAGKYYLDICYTYEVNPIRAITVNVRTQEFEVK